MNTKPPRRRPTRKAVSSTMAAGPRLVLRAFANGVSLVRVLSEPIVNGWTLRCFVNGTERNPTKAELASLDWVIFHHESPDDAIEGGALLALPLLKGKPADRTKLNVTNPGKSNARLNVSGAWRCVVADLKGANEDAQDFTCVIDHAPATAGRPPAFRFRSINLMFPEASDQKDIQFGALHSLEWEQIAKGGFFPPVIGEFLQVRVGAVLPQFEFVRRVRFKLHPATAASQGTPGSPAANPSLLLETLMEVVLEDKPHRLFPLDLAFTVDGLPRRTDVAYTWFVQRQPRETPSTPDAVGHVRWLFDVIVPAEHSLACWNRLVIDPVVDALHTVQRGSPVSFLPHMAALGTKQGLWRATFSLVDRSARGELKTADYVEGALGQGSWADDTVTVIARRLAPLGLVPSSPAEPTPAALPAMATFTAVKTAEAGKALAVGVLLAADPAQEVGYSLEPPNRVFDLTVRQLQPVDSSPQTVRMGALDLMFARTSEQVSAGEATDRLQAVFRSASAPSGATRPGRIECRSARLRLALLSLAPGGQDPLPDDVFAVAPRECSERPSGEADRRAIPLTIPVAKPTSVAEPQAELEILEDVPPDFSQTIQFRLYQRGNRGVFAGRNQILVVDPEPLLVCAVDFADFEQDLQLGITNEIGNWNNRGDQSGWELSAGAQGYTLVLPPQGLGEAMHKRRGLDDVIPGRPVDFLFTPPARLKLRQTLFEQRFAEAPWNLRRVLGFPGQRMPGALMDEAEFELLYGVHASVRRATLRVAEAGARLGSSAAALPLVLPWRASQQQQDGFTLAARAWNGLTRTLRSRLAALEPWDERQPAGVRLTQDEGLRFTLRPTTHLRYPIRGLIGPNGNPEPGFETTGLAGGYAWGFESANIFAALLKDRRSTDGEVVRPFFSALGGWGYQKATFDRGLTTIYATVEMGRVSSLNIERIGRISTFWNRAKHVIVYERSVAASRQFYLEQHKLRGAPMLRKVREYVEILQPERPFPDLAGAPAQAAGCLKALFFPGDPPRIPVNSQWGDEVDSTGWKVPLWLRGAEPKDVYGRPDIRFHFAAREPGSTVPQQTREPEKLFFYTRTADDFGNDPDGWPSVNGVDFVPYPAPSLEPPRATPRAGDPAHYGATDRAFAPGLTKFTFALEPATGVTDIVAARSAEAIVAGLQNVTVMRSLAHSRGTADNKPAIVEDAFANTFGRLFANLPASDVAAPPEVVKDLVRDAELKWNDFRRAYGDAVAVLQSQASGGFERAICGALRRRLETQFDVYRSMLREQVDRAIADVVGSVLALRDTIPDPADQRVLKKLEEFVSDAKDAVASARGLSSEAVTLLAVAEEQIEGAGSRLLGELGDAIVLVENLTEWEQDPGAQHEVEMLIDGVREAVESGLRLIEFAIAEAARPFTGDRLDVARLSVRAFRTTSHSILRKLRYDVRDITRIPREDVLAALHEAVAGLDAFLLGISDRLRSWRETLETVRPEELHEWIDDIHARIREVLFSAGSWQKVAERFGGFIGDADYRNLDTALDSLRSKLEGEAERLCQTFLPKLDDIIDAFPRDLLSRLVADLGDGLTFATLRDEIGRMVDALAGDVQEFLRRAAITIPLPEIGAISPDGMLRLLRGFGEPPRVPSLDFALPEIGYYFWDPARLDLPLPHVDLTPVVAFANKLGAGVFNALDVSLPSIRLTDRLQPPDLSNFDLSKVFGNFGGLRNQGLFPALRLPALATDRVKITHGVNEQLRTAWLQADVDVPFGEQPAPVFTLAGVTLRLLQSRFQATLRIEGGPGKPPRQTSRGSITGNWDLQVGGMPLAILVDSTLRFDESGRLHFDVSPDRVRLQQALAFIAEILRKFDYSGKGFTVSVTPAGVETVLDLPLPDVQAGTFGISNLRLGFAFGLELPDFRIRTSLQLGRKRAPFTITVFILGGAGYIESSVVYTPSTGQLEVGVQVGIFASAGLAIALGPIRGGVFVYFGIAVSYVSKASNPSRLSISLILMFTGHVSLLGIVSVTLSLGLEGRYTDGGGLVGRGWLSLSIKICWFLTIEVNTAVEYTFGGAGGRRRAMIASNGNPYEDAARRYLDMFEKVP